MARRIIEAAEITETDETTFVPVTHQGGDGRVCIRPASTEYDGLMTAQMVQTLNQLAEAVLGNGGDAPGPSPEPSLVELIDAGLADWQGSPEETTVTDESGSLRITYGSGHASGTPPRAFRNLSLQVGEQYRLTVTPEQRSNDPAASYRVRVSNSHSSGGGAQAIATSDITQSNDPIVIEFEATEEIGIYLFSWSAIGESSVGSFAQYSSAVIEGPL